jgi:hypothetical protein
MFMLGLNGGIVTTSHVDPVNDTAITRACLYPADLQSYTRKPLFLVVDSTCSTVYRVSC